MSKLFAIPWWSIPLFCVGMYDLFIGNSQGLIILGLTGLMAFLLRVVSYKAKKLLTIPWWSAPFFYMALQDILSTKYDLTAIIITGPGTVLLLVTFAITITFIILVYRNNTKTKVICPTCNRETWKYPDGKLPTTHRSGQCTKSGFVEPRKPRF